MAPLNEAEIDSLIASAPDLSGGVLQQCLYDEKALLLQVHKSQKSCWLAFSLKPGHPYFFCTEQRIPLFKNLKKPLALFLKTHFVEEKVEKLFRVKELGRVIEIGLGNEKKLVVSFVPGRVNVEAVVGDKKVFAFRPKNLEKQEPFSEKNSEKKNRDHSWFVDQWQNRPGGQKKPSEKDFSKEIKKKKNGLQKMQEKLDEYLQDDWEKLGEWLKEHQSFEGLPGSLEEKVDSSQSFAWNIENAFHQAKKNKAKIEGTRQRLETLEKEIEKMEKGESLPKKPASGESLFSLADTKGRTLDLEEGRLYIGRSGPENLKLLRKAKPWYIWLHIKDYPGAHGIIEPYKKKFPLSEKVLRIAGEKVIVQSLPKGASGHFEVVYAECRYVRPIKGAKSGQVTYSHEKVLGLRLEP